MSKNKKDRTPKFRYFVLDITRPAENTQAVVRIENGSEVEVGGGHDADVRIQGLHDTHVKLRGAGDQLFTVIPYGLTRAIVNEVPLVVECKSEFGFGTKLVLLSDIEVVVRLEWLTKAEAKRRPGYVEILQMPTQGQQTSEPELMSEAEPEIGEGDEDGDGIESPEEPPPPIKPPEIATPPRTVDETTVEIPDLNTLVVPKPAHPPLVDEEIRAEAERTMVVDKSLLPSIKRQEVPIHNFNAAPDTPAALKKADWRVVAAILLIGTGAIFLLISLLIRQEQMSATTPSSVEAALPAAVADMSEIVVKVETDDALPVAAKAAEKQTLAEPTVARPVSSPPAETIQAKKVTPAGPKKEKSESATEEGEDKGEPTPPPPSTKKDYTCQLGGLGALRIGPTFLKQYRRFDDADPPPDQKMWWRCKPGQEQNTDNPQFKDRSLCQVCTRNE